MGDPGRVAAPAAVEASATYPGVPASVAEVRRFVRAALADSPRADDLALVASELATNAIRHSPSGQAGGTFAVTVRQAPGCARLEITDPGGGPWRLPRRGAELAEHGRGLVIVAALADAFGGAAVPAGRVMWAEVLTAECE
jgi:anti-sigma regulatory factor (Ser/Thr protein kinase)